LFSILIFEEDELSAKWIYSFVSEIFNEPVDVRYFVTEESAYTHAKAQKIDLFIVKVNSGSCSGFTFTNQIRQDKNYIASFVIILSPNLYGTLCRMVHDKLYCFRSFDTNPLNESALRQAILSLSEYEVVFRGNGYIIMIGDSASKSFKLADILWVGIDDGIITLNMADGTVSKYPLNDYPFGKLQGMLGRNFIRIYRSIIVNKDHVETIDFPSRTLKLRDLERTFKLGLTYMPMLKTMFGYTRKKRKSK